MIDATKKYLAPMALETDPYGEQKMIEMVIEVRDSMIVGTPLVEGYTKHYYRAPFFEWLIYTKKIIMED